MSADVTMSTPAPAPTTLEAMEVTETRTEIFNLNSKNYRDSELEIALLIERDENARLRGVAAEFAKQLAPALACMRSGDTTEVLQNVVGMMVHMQHFLAAFSAMPGLDASRLTPGTTRPPL